MSKDKVFTHTGVLRKYERVRLRQTEKFWFDETGRRYGKSDGLCKQRRFFRLDLDTIEDEDWRDGNANE